MKYIFTLIALSLFTYTVNAQSIPIPQDTYDIIDFSSDNGNHPVNHAFDTDTATWWAIYNTDGFGLPAFVEIDLIEFYDINGFSYLPNSASSNDKAIGYEIYLSDEGDDWGSAESTGSFDWESPGDVSRKDIYFGAVSGEYVRILFTSSQNTGNGNIHTADLVIYESTIPASGQMNQTISLDPIVKKYADDDPFQLDGVASSGLPITYTIVSGPATIDGDILTLTGEEGIVELLASQSGDDDYFSVEQSQSFIVVDLSLIYPLLSTRLTEDYPIEMPELYAYPIYISTSIGEPNALEITSVDIEIDGTVYPAVYNGAYYYYLWTPDDYGVYSINITTNASNGNSDELSRIVTVAEIASTQTITTLEDVVIEFGGTNSRWYYGSYTLPQHVGSYDQIMAYLTIECPNGNCDDWDRLAYIDVKDRGGNWIQIIRYITPYGVACDHEIDLTDYASVLQGELEFRMFIDTWGTGGWQVTLDLEHIAGTPDYLYTNVYEIWDGTYDLGNPANLQSVDTVSFIYESNILSSHMRLSTTGHGWGQNNSQNAAEFYHAYNFIDIDSVQNYTQNLWNTCNPNPDDCSPQGGTWEFSRAGWCPGAISPPNIIDMDDQIGSDTLLLTYRLAPTYIDFCHPNNPNCISGVTCTNCNDGYNPHYVVDAHLINYSNTPIIYDATNVEYIDNDLQYDIELYPNPSSGKFMVGISDPIGKCKLRIMNMAGQDVAVYYFEDGAALNGYSFDISNQSNGVYFINIETVDGVGVKKLILR